MTKVSLAALLFLPLSPLAHGFTECHNLSIARVWADVDGNFYVATMSGWLNGMVARTSANYSTVVAIALAAKATGSTVSIRYTRDGVTCGQAEWNEPISGFGM